MGTFYFKVSSIYRLYSKCPNCQFSHNFYNYKKLRRAGQQWPWWVLYDPRGSQSVKLRETRRENVRSRDEMVSCGCECACTRTCPRLVASINELQTSDSTKLSRLLTHRCFLAAQINRFSEWIIRIVVCFLSRLLTILGRPKSFFRFIRW